MICLSQKHRIKNKNHLAESRDRAEQEKNILSKPWNVLRLLGINEHKPVIWFDAFNELQLIIEKNYTEKMKVFLLWLLVHKRTCFDGIFFLLRLSFRLGIEIEKPLVFQCVWQNNALHCLSVVRFNQMICFAFFLRQNSYSWIFNTV